MCGNLKMWSVIMQFEYKGKVLLNWFDNSNNGLTGLCNKDLYVLRKPRFALIKSAKNVLRAPVLFLQF